jgi:hypothetical protein
LQRKSFLFCPIFIQFWSTLHWYSQKSDRTNIILGILRKMRRISWLALQLRGVRKFANIGLKWRPRKVKKGRPQHCFQIYVISFGITTLLTRTDFWDIKRRVVSLKYTDFSEVCTASIIRAMIRISPWWRRHYVPLKRRSNSTRLHGAISQKGVTFILSAVRTWNLTTTLVFSDFTDYRPDDEGSTSEASVNFWETTLCNISEDSHLQPFHSLHL